MCVVGGKNDGCIHIIKKPHTQPLSKGKGEWYALLLGDKNQYFDASRTICTNRTYSKKPENNQKAFGLTT